MKRQALAVLAALAVIDGSGAARADEPKSASVDAARKEAQALFTQALDKANAGDSRGALAAFRTAYDRYPSFRVLYNIGQICTRLDDSACSYRAYDQYLRDGGADVPAPRRTEVAAALLVLHRKIATVTITSNVSGAELRVDDASVGRTPLPAPIILNGGVHSLVLVQDDKKVERSVKLEGVGETITIDLPVPKEETAPAAPVTATPAPSAEKPKRGATTATPRPFPIVPWAVSGGFAVATIVTGVIAATSYSSFKDTRDRLGVTPGELDDSQSTARNWFLVTGLLGTITIVSAGVAGYFTFLAPGSQPKAAAAKGSSTLRNVSIGPRGVMLEGVFQ